MTNRLAEAKSLYLRKHAENPIDWWPWCDEALSTAKAQNKPIFLSIGYSSCHWCTVMEGEAFSDPGIAEYMNANFIPIKVDREERPDIDSIYMQALQMMSGQGGWPLNAFLSPDDLVPFYAGTYFPVEPRYGRPGFLQVLQAIRHYYDTEKQDLRDRKAVILESLLTSAVLQQQGTTATQDKELLHKGWETSTGIITPNQYGNSFPMIPYAELALRGTRFEVTSEYDGKQVCTQRGLDLALGGIYDHVGGGFHRYTVDPTWTVPHFEKMLYDNGQIVEYLANLWSAGIEEPAFKRAIAGTVQWLKREMTAPEGYFYAAQDADSFTPPTPPYQGGDKGGSEPEEGAFYVWTFSELEQLLTAEELIELQQQFTVTANGNFESKNVLQRRRSGELSATVETALRKLFVARYGATPESLETFPPARNNQEAKSRHWPGRIPAVTDTKMIVAWNSLMISGLARAYAVFREPVYLELATTAADFIVNHQFVDGRFHRLNYENQPTVLAQSEDYAFFIKALLDLQTCSPEQNKWLERAIALQEEFDEYLWSVELGGYYNTSSDASQDLIVRERSYVDNATPSANGVAIANLVRLALFTDNLHYLDLAEQGLNAFRSVMNSTPQACPSLFTALDWYRNSTLIRTTTEQLHSLMSQYLPSVVFAIASKLPDNSVGLVCQGLKCLPAASSLEQMLQQVRQSQVRG
ncbi:thioredoxin domain-containing protein [Fischerella thermalis]|uniref:thioredoxin domain-containing protein n=2 Tax=Fischerella thermalis TaxID=372787 RepID=UPI000C8053C8|nr:thioredoxin domain-containing protein [Fischerella thermalis]PLZ14324.1 thioredoxin domain-containing protein [Fischerella thermalis WC119]PLZ61593.1 thioredoxin domain-containing protein [Fischerella thermalis WC344]PLZ63416.1 thioredoxin domain-containing protein [Fischerella thermalis WC249]PLZ73909.1 thioredoxin domain-containing protein [Fischerella thermalis WC245]RDH47550.1 thioredoxin domain-containing protein [Fischerella thermalis 111/344/542]